MIVTVSTDLLKEAGQVFPAAPGPGEGACLGAEGGGHDGPCVVMTVVV